MILSNVERGTCVSARGSRPAHSESSTTTKTSNISRIHRKEVTHLHAEAWQHLATLQLLLRSEFP